LVDWPCQHTISNNTWSTTNPIIDRIGNSRGCIGSMLYIAVILMNVHPFADRPDDMWETKWSGIPVYVASTIYCIEGINLALPTVCSIEGASRQQSEGGGAKAKEGDEQQPSTPMKQSLSVIIVVGAVFSYGIITLIVSWIGLAIGIYAITRRGISINTATIPKYTITRGMAR